MAYDFIADRTSGQHDMKGCPLLAGLPVDGERPISPVLRSALQDAAVPHEVKRLVMGLKMLDPVNATLEARTLARALQGDHRDAVGIFGGGQLMRRALREWELDLSEEQRHILASILVNVMNGWADAELAAVL